ncbi:hypothetical protein [Paenibacillus amylolyticus]|uniref:hypothetical protein n=1 Tax=Paenibacillus amylolyticus TaxID=1451 RepID=UPI003399EDA4
MNKGTLSAITGKTIKKTIYKSQNPDKEGFGIMNPFPEDHELVSLFESEPRVLDNEVPWYYNTLFFSLVRNNDHIECKIEPAYSTMSFRLMIENRLIYDLHFENIEGMEIEKCKDKEYLKIIFNDEDTVKTLLLETKPNINLISTNNNNFRK